MTIHPSQLPTKSMSISPAKLTPEQGLPRYAPDWYAEPPILIYDAKRPARQEQPTRSKVGLSTALISAFFVLVLFKQTQVLDWSWWWVSLPLWLMPAGYGLLIIAVILISLWHELKRAQRRRKYKLS
ncbi:hypothetical protein GO755_33595 [Spirosoma sp. HMF4905]|uniref:Transmembrane protein n=1 Tax=Spirosoma arboris TaxID=2682092 RepID=A0A7K1SMI4_9BACT|nr:hypothetical protein [Spirosoma arboris]MVM35010.1 hypothetical protein [Spirosoma arboris]